MANTIVTVFDEARTILDKYSNQLPDTDLKRVMYKYVVAQESTYTFEKVTTDVYTYLGDKHLFLLNPTFTAESGVDYTTYASGTIEVDDSSPYVADSRTQIDVTGARVRFYGAIAELLKLLAVRYAESGNVSFGGTSVSTATVRSELMAQASHYAQMDELYGW